jgi:hypothetical protein
MGYEAFGIRPERHLTPTPVDDHPEEHAEGGTDEGGQADHRQHGAHEDVDTDASERFHGARDTGADEGPEAHASAEATSKRVRVLHVESTRRKRDVAFVVAKGDQLRDGSLRTVSGGVASDGVAALRSRIERCCSHDLPLSSITTCPGVCQHGHIRVSMS